MIDKFLKAAHKCGLFFLSIIILFLSSSCYSNRYKESYINGLNALDKNDKTLARELFSYASLGKNQLIKNLATKRLEALPVEVEEENISYYVSQRKYAKAFELIQTPIEDFLIQTADKDLSDVGKTFLYGQTDYEQSAKSFYNVYKQSEIKLENQTVNQNVNQNIIENKFSNEKKFYLLFYAARLFDKAGSNYRNEAINLLEESLQFASSPKNIDSSVYYIFLIASKLSVDDALNQIKKYCTLINDRSWYTDFFESFSSKILGQQRYKDYFYFYQLIHDFCDTEITVKFSYVCARLIQCKYLNVNIPAEKFFDEVLRNSSDDDYYHILTSKKIFDTKNNVNDNKINSPDKKKSKQFYKLIEELIESSKINWVCKLIDENIDLLDDKQLINISDEIYKKSLKDSDLYSLSIRLTGILKNKKNISLDKKHLQYFYPKYYTNYISASAKKYSLPENILYSLIHAESLFKSNAVSHAGAIGLMQLMPLTAGDVAKKLKRIDYDLKDPATNIEFGSFYIAEMIRRLDNNPVEAICAYNAGITTVRRWKKSFGELPLDIFLETIPYEETRNYGKYLVRNMCMYNYLYDNIPIEKTLQILRF